MEIMRRYEARLARLEEFARWWLREEELKRTRPERIARWMRILAPRYAPTPPGRGPRRPEAQPKDLAVRQGPVDASGPSPDGSGRHEKEMPPAQQPTAPSLSPPSPPRPIVEFINERAGMSVAIDTRTGQMADSATVLMALRTPPGKEPES